MIKRELKRLRITGKRVEKAEPHNPIKIRDTHLDTDRRLSLFSFTPDTFSMLLVPMIMEKLIFNKFLIFFLEKKLSALWEMMLRWVINFFKSFNRFI